MPLAFYNKKFNNLEPDIEKAGFTVYKFNNRLRPNKTNRIKIIGCFSEFGCEIVGCLYCIPQLLRRYPGQYTIAMGWYGRSYLYKHLVDEFWEIEENLMWLRNYSRAFHFKSNNLTNIEKHASIYGEVIPSAVLGKYAVANYCKTCGKFWHEWRKKNEECPSCKSTVLVRSLFSNIQESKKEVKFIPKPRKEFIQWAKDFVKPKTVGIFARNRKTYGRNLNQEFYKKLINLLELFGYNIIWLGEKSTTLPCPRSDILDFSRDNDSKDIEKTLSIICQLDFTIQFWTASSRLSGIMGKPFLLVESPEQVYTSLSGFSPAQEGKRLELCSFGKKKIVICHFKNSQNNESGLLDLIKQAINDMQNDNWEDIIGLVEDREFVKVLQKEHYEMLI